MHAQAVRPLEILGHALRPAAAVELPPGIQALAILASSLTASTP